VVKAILVDSWVKAAYVRVHDLLVVGDLVVQLDGIGTTAKKGFPRVCWIHDVDCLEEGLHLWVGLELAFIVALPYFFDDPTGLLQLLLALQCARVGFGGRVHVIGSQLTSHHHVLWAAVPVAAVELKHFDSIDAVLLVLNNLPLAINIVSGIPDMNILLVAEPFEPLEGLY